MRCTVRASQCPDRARDGSDEADAGGVKFIAMRPAANLVFVALIGAIALAQPSLAQKPARTPDCEPASPSNSPKTPNTKPCPAPPVTDAPSVRDRFPYPGEPATPPPDAPSTPASPAQAPAPSTSPEPGKQFPYPGDPAASSSSSSSSSSSGSSSSSASDDSTSPTPDASGTDAPWTGDADSSKRRTLRRKLPKVKQIQSNEDRENEDLTVAKFYLQSGNPQAAYSRTKDAVNLQPDDPEAHFALAEAARSLSKRDEAVAEYNAYLKLDPDGDHVKAAKKAVAALR